MNMPTSGQVAAFGRHVVSYSMGFVSAAVMLHVVSAGDGQSAMGAIGQIADGAKSVIAGAATLISLGAGHYAGLTASPLWQLISVSRNPAVKSVVADAPLANAVPSSKVQPPAA